MESDVLPYFLGTVALSSWALAALALAVSLRVLRSTRARKQTPSSLAESSSELASALAAEKISHQLQKLENRLRMREQRTQATQKPLAPPEGAGKAELYRAYGFVQAGPQFAQHQLDLERSRKHQEH